MEFPIHHKYGIYKKQLFFSTSQMLVTLEMPIEIVLPSSESRCWEACQYLLPNHQKVMMEFSW